VPSFNWEGLPTPVLLLLYLLHCSLPIFIGICLCCYLDRTNLAFASISLNKDLFFSAEVGDPNCLLHRRSKQTVQLRSPTTCYTCKHISITCCMEDLKQNTHLWISTTCFSYNASMSELISRPPGFIFHADIWVGSWPVLSGLLPAHGALPAAAAPSRGTCIPRWQRHGLGWVGHGGVAGYNATLQPQHTRCTVVLCAWFWPHPGPHKRPWSCSLALACA
jgi:hypothetical protein